MSVLKFRQFFTFRDLMRELGIPMSNEANWQAGQVLRALARNRGIEPLRIMADKTDPNPSVAAQHVIAHYPISFFREAKEYFLLRFEEDRKQLPMFPDAELPAPLLHAEGTIGPTHFQTTGSKWWKFWAR